MLAHNIAFRRNLFDFRKQYLKPLTLFWRSQRTEAKQMESPETFDGVRSFDEIPEPKGLKFMYDLCTKTEGFTKAYKITERLFHDLGPVYKEDLMFRPTMTVHVKDPDDFEKVFRAEGKYPRRLIFDFMVEHRKRRNHWPGIILVNGEEWHRLRQTIAPKIMRPKIVEENIVNFNAVSKDAVARFVKLKDACKQDDHIPDLEKELNRWSLEGIGTLAFDTRLGLYEDPPPRSTLEFTNAVNSFFELAQQLLFNIFSRIARPYIDTPTFKKFLVNADALFEIGQVFVDKKMSELNKMAEKGIDPSNAQVVPLLAYLLMKDDLTPEEVNGHAIDIVTGGVDTTSNATLWWLYNLARFPTVQEKVYQEIKSVLGNDGDVTPQHLAKLRYLKACLKESMRLTPSTTANVRFLDEDVVLSGYQVPAQTFVSMELYATTRSDKYFKDPLEFKPERWLRGTKDVHSFSHLQFGFGPRMCVVTSEISLRVSPRATRNTSKDAYCSRQTGQNQVYPSFLRTLQGKGSTASYNTLFVNLIHTGKGF